MGGQSGGSVGTGQKATPSGSGGSTKKSTGNSFGGWQAGGGRSTRDVGGGDRVEETGPNAAFDDELMRMVMALAQQQANQNQDYIPKDEEFQVGGSYGRRR